MAYYKKSFLFGLIVLSIAINVYFRMNPFFLRQFDSAVKEYYRDENGYTYLIEADSYRWLRRVESFLETGHFGNTRVNNHEYDNLMFAPFGAKIEPLKLHFLIGAYSYKILHSINNRLTLPECLSFISPLLSIILVLSVFSICLLFGISYLGSFLSSLAVCLSFIVLQRSCFGWFDTDIYNLIIPITVLSMLARSIRSEYPKKYYYLLLAGLFTGLHSSLWSIWWLPFFITLAGLSLYQFEVLIYNKRDSFSYKLKDSCFSVFTFFISSYLFVLFISGFDIVKNSFFEPFRYITLRHGAALDNFWPDVAFSIGELKKTDISGLAQQLGGYLVLYGGIFAILLLFILQKKSPRLKEKRFLLLSLFFWMASMFCLTLFGRRFIMFLAIPLGISFGALWDFFAGAGFLKRARKQVSFTLLGCIFMLVVLMFTKSANSMEIRPLMNDTLWGALVKLKEVTPADAVIATRWDLSDYVMTIAKRATIDDASWQFTPLPYWQNRALLSNNGQESLGIWRMLNSAGNSAFDELSANLGNNKLLSVELVNKMLLLKREEAHMLLSSYIKDKDKIEVILRFMYGAKKPAYLLIDNYINNVVETLGRIASWDFTRLDLFQKSSVFKKDEFINYAKLKYGYSEKTAAGLYDALKVTDKGESVKWISARDFRIYTARSKISIEGDPGKIIFDNGIVLDAKSMKSYFLNFTGERLIPGRLIFFDKNKKVVNEYKDSEGNPALCVLLRKEGSAYSSILLSAPLADSLFFKLYFTEGLGQNNFELVYQETKEGFSNIYLYKINL